MEIEKYIGAHRKGNSNDGFGFISGMYHTNLFIHDKEFVEDIDFYNGHNVFVTYRVRPSKFKKGSNEGYEGKTISNENDIDFLINELNKILFPSKGKNLTYGNYSLCEAIITQLKKLNVPEEKVSFFRDYFNDENIQSLISNKNESIFLQIMKFGLSTFFLVESENLSKKINEHQEKELLKQMGYEGADKYEALTETFFNNFSQFEKFFYQFPKVVNKEFIYKIILESESLPFENSFESIRRFVNIISGENLTISDKYKLKREEKKRNQFFNYSYSESRSSSFTGKKSETYLTDKEDAFRIFSNLSTPKIRLYLWLNGLTDKFDFNDYKESIWQLQKEDQAIFIKRIFLWMALGNILLNVEDLYNIKVFNIDMYRAIKKEEPKKSFINLDFNVSLLVYIINAFGNKAKFDSNKIFEHFIEYVNDETEMEHLDFFYPECCGRTRGNKKEIIDSETHEPKINQETGLPEFEYSFYHHENDKPLFHELCDGLKASDNRLGFPKPYSWCAGMPCFDPANSKPLDLEKWQDWTIIEFLQVLKIDYETNYLSALLGYINKANVLIERLKCKACNKLMTPESQNQYAYFQHNKFSCKNSSCSEYNKTVYLSHCHSCGNYIDSRISKKCTQEGFQSGGWYICDCCYSCCSTDAINRIIEKKRLNGLEYYGPSIGHDQLRTIFCYNCGDKMNLNLTFYKTQLEIIESLKSNKNGFVENKEENNGSWKFRLDFGKVRHNLHEEGLQKLKNHGFKVTKASRENLYFVDRLIAISVRCNNKDCSYSEVFTPEKKKWKSFNDNHLYLSDKVKKFYISGNIDDLDEQQPITAPIPNSL